MATFVGFLAFAYLLSASPIPEGVLTDISPKEQAPIGCSVNYNGPFAIAVERIHPASHRRLMSRQELHHSDPPMLSQIEDGQIQAPGNQYPPPQPDHETSCYPGQPGCQGSQDSQSCSPGSPGCDQLSPPQSPSPIPRPPSITSQLPSLLPPSCQEGTKGCTPHTSHNLGPCTCGGRPTYPCMCGGNPCTCSISTSTCTPGQSDCLPTPPPCQPGSLGCQIPPTSEDSNESCENGNSGCFPAAPEKSEEPLQPPRGGQPWCVSPSCEGSSCQPGQLGCGTIISQIKDGQVQIPNHGRKLLATREITSNITKRSELSDVIETLNAAGTLVTRLENGKLVDAYGRRGYIAGNRQFQFDNPPQSGSIYTSGFSLCEQGNLALGNSVVWHQCRSGDFYNLYDMDIAPQCEEVRLVAVPLRLEHEEGDE